jgi:hypothetical protein
MESTRSETLGSSVVALLSDSEAARQLAVSASTLRSWRCRGIGPSYVKMGHGKKSPVRYTASDIDQFICQCRQVPPLVLPVRAAMEN